MPLFSTPSSTIRAIASRATGISTQMAFGDAYSRSRWASRRKTRPPYARMPSNTPSPYSRPWSNTETTALLRSNHVPSIHTMEGMGGNLPRMLCGDNRGGGGAGGRHSNEAAGDRTQDLRIKSPLLYQLSYRLGWPKDSDPS